MNDVNAPTLILIGELDDWTPASLCIARVSAQDDHNKKVILKVYPGAYHSFDRIREYGAGSSWGHYMAYSPSATSDAILKTKEFLEKYLR